MMRVMMRVPTRAALMLAASLVSTAALASTFVYVSNADDGDIGQYQLTDDGRLLPGPRIQAGEQVMPMALSPDRRLLIAAVRAKPYAAISYRIDPGNGTLTPIANAPLAESFAYITFDHSGNFLLAASYGAHLVASYPVDAAGLVGAQLQTLATAPNAHAIITDRSNRFAFAPHLGSDQVRQFHFDASSGRLTPNSEPALQLSRASGPRHLIASADNRFFYLLNEHLATVTTLALDAQTGRLSELASASALPPDSQLVAGPPMGGNRSGVIWASDLHLTPNGKFLYAAERASSTIARFKVDSASGKLTYLGSTPTEQQPRGFRIAPSGRFMIVSGEKSATISSYAINVSTGALSRVDQAPTGKGSNWVEIVSFD